MKLLKAIILILLFTSCTKEIIVADEVRTTVEQQSEKLDTESIVNESNSENQRSSAFIAPLSKEEIKQEKVYFVRGTYHLDTIEVNKPVEGGPRLIQGLGNLIADVIVRIGGNFDVEMDALPMDVSDIDPDLIKSAVVKNIKLEVMDKSSKKTRLDFLKKLKLSLVNQKDDKKVELFNKKYIKKEEGRTICGYWCLDIPVNKVNLIDYIQDTKEILIQPEVEIGKTPKEKFELKISIDFEIGLVMPI